MFEILKNFKASEYIHKTFIQDSNTIDDHNAGHYVELAGNKTDTNNTTDTD